MNYGITSGHDAYDLLFDFYKETQKHKAHHMDRRYECDQWEAVLHNGNPALTTKHPDLWEHEPFAIESNAVPDLALRLVRGLHPDSSRSSLSIPDMRGWDTRYPDLFVDMVNRLLNAPDVADKPILVRGYLDNPDGNSGVVRAVLGQRYVPLNNADLTAALNPIFSALEEQNVGLGMRKNEHGGDDTMHLVRPWVTRDAMHIKVIYRNVQVDMGNGKKEGFGTGFVIRNDEVGQGALEIAPLIQRHSCTNSIIVRYDEQGKDLGLRRGHVSRINPQELTVTLQGILKEIVISEEMSNYILGRVSQSTQEFVADFAKSLGSLGKTLGISEEDQKVIAMGTEGSDSVMGLVNGLTYYAHKNHGDNPARMMELETAAGDLLMHPRQYVRVAA